VQIKERKPADWAFYRATLQDKTGYKLKSAIVKKEIKEN
jgi:hypothetical protein